MEPTKESILKSIDIDLKMGEAGLRGAIAWYVRDGYDVKIYKLIDTETLMDLTLLFDKDDLIRYENKILERLIDKEHAGHWRDPMDMAKEAI